MKRGLISLGQRTLQGEYGTVLAAGALQISDSRVRRLSVAGQLQANKSFFGKVSCAGELIGEEIQFTRLSISGSANLTQICKGDIVSVKGFVAAEYLECRILQNGMGQKKNEGKEDAFVCWQGVYHADTFESCGAILMSFEYRFRNIISHAGFRCHGEIECESFYSFSDLDVESVNAERIFLLSRANIRVGQLTGTHVSIKNNFKADQLYKGLPKTMVYRKQKKPNQIAVVGSIEADYITLEYTKADFISGNDIYIGDMCIIEYVEYRNSITISEKAVVNEVVRI